MGQSMAVSTLLRRVGRLLTNPSEGDQLVFIGKGDRKPPKQVDMGNSGFVVFVNHGRTFPLELTWVIAPAHSMRRGQEIAELETLPTLSFKT